MRTPLAIIFILLLSPAHSLAQMYQCGDTWQSEPCESGEPSAVVGSSSSDSESDADVRKARSEKDSLVHELTMQRIRARDEFGIQFSIDNTRSFCADASTSVAECRERVEKTSEGLESKVREERLVRAKEREVAIQEEKSNEPPAVVVIERERTIVVPPKHHRNRDGHFHRERTTSGAGIRVEAGSDNANVVIEGNSQSTTVQQESETGTVPPGKRKSLFRGVGSPFVK